MVSTQGAVRLVRREEPKRRAIIGPIDLHLELSGAGPKRAELERRLRDAVRTGRLRPGTRLPPSRTLARDLGVSRGVVVEAYEQLVAEGWLTARRGAGTTVAGGVTGTDPVTPAQRGQTLFHATGTEPVSRNRDRPCFTQRGQTLFHATGSDPVARYDLRTGQPDLAAFPRAAWGAAVGRALRGLPDAALGYGDPRGNAPLREALAAHLGRTRGVLAAPEHVVVCGGLSQGLTVLWRALARHGARRVAIEQPGWRGQRRSVELAGLEPVPVPVDARGLVVDALGDVDAVAVTPAHQFPTGVVLAPERRAALVAWAQARGTLVVEDDYDAEYRYDRDPVGALQGLAPDHVVYGGSASKTLAPALRLGWLVVPERLVADVAAEKDRADRGTPVLEQAALADLMRRGEVDRHLRRTRRRYRARRDALVAALAEHAPQVAVGGAAAGLHVVAWLPPGTDEDATAGACARAGVAVDRLGGETPALLLGYGALPEDALRRAAAAIGAVLRREPRPA